MKIIASDRFWLAVIALWILVISWFHLRTPAEDGHVHLILMQTYFIPVLIAAFRFGVRGGVASALVIGAIFAPHIMLQWTGDFEHNLLAFLTICIFLIIGFFTGLKAQKEIDEKRRYQQAARDLEESLDQLRRQAGELAVLEEQLRLSDRLAVVGELTSSLAHELRNPLGTIRGTVEILNEELPEEARNTEFFQILIKETERMSAVVENYLNFARKQKAPDSIYDIREIVETTGMILASRARRDRVRLRVTLPDRDLPITGDPNDLRQILVNLIMNGLEAMTEPGHIDIAGRIVQPADVSTTFAEDVRDTPVLQLTVTDQGPGISPEAQVQIFQPFFTTKMDGTGLGLSIVKRIADRHHWHIAVTSTEGKGTTFTLSMPIDSSVPAE